MGLIDGFYVDLLFFKFHSGQIALIFVAQGKGSCFCCLIAINWSLFYCCFEFRNEHVSGLLYASLIVAHKR